MGGILLPQGPLGNKIAVVSPSVMRLCNCSNILEEGGKLLTALKLLVALVGGSNPNKSLGGKLLTAL